MQVQAHTQFFQTKTSDVTLPKDDRTLRGATLPVAASHPGSHAIFGTGVKCLTTTVRQLHQ
jgi:hypothetical protein